MIRLLLDGSTCVLSPYDDNSVILTWLFTQPAKRRTGSAKRLLRAVRKWAQRKGKSVVLFAAPYGDAPLSQEGLQRFYERMGYRVYRRDFNEIWMRLTP